MSKHEGKRKKEKGRKATQKGNMEYSFKTIQITIHRFVF